MNVGRQAIRVFEGADAHKANGIACSRVIAPQSDAALWTAGYLLALSTVRRGVHDLRDALQHSHAVSFDQGVERKRRAGFPLTPAAMTAVNKQRRSCHSITHRAAGATAFQRRIIIGIHSTVLPVLLESTGQSERSRGHRKLPRADSILRQTFEHCRGSLDRSCSASFFVLLFLIFGCLSPCAESLLPRL